ncbi:SDR family NAD(P)-dependent oxidoreductase [Pendulispora brunnea]|uniref:SDR family NAD(P)-dependent oxidoreductase n=1 Tax=Pendulispora brunnea TaxID=2905690 RepID=A0ABZ2KIJ1_9BACT
MTQLVEYLLKEMKAGRLSKADALHLLAQQRSPMSNGGHAGHPLAQRNTSSLDGQRFSSTLRGDSFFLSDHVVKGRKMLPAVCYLEMACAAVRASLEQRAGVALRDIRWLRPLVVSDVREVHIALHRQEGGDVAFEIYTDVVHAQGLARLTDSPALPPIDVAALRARCDRSIERARVYSAFQSIGLEYGPAHQGLTAVHVGTDTDGRRFVVARVELPVGVGSTRDQFALHPSVLDGALQASLGLVLDDGGLQPALPFALDALDVVDRTPALAWVIVRPREMGSVQRLDIDVCDEDGRVCVHLGGFASRVVSESETREELPARTMTLTPRWEAQPPAWTTAWPSAESSVLLVGDAPERFAPMEWWRQRHPRLHTLLAGPDASVETLSARIAAAGPIDHVIWLAPPSAMHSLADEAILEGQEAGVVALYRLVKSLLSLGYGERALGLSAITWQAQPVSQAERIDPTHASVHGLIGSLAKEYEGWKVRLVDLPSEVNPKEALAAETLRLPADPQGNAWAYRHGEWYRQQLVPCELEASKQPHYRHGGVYVVIGGAGGLGEVFSEHLIRQHQAHVVWVGRREENAEIRAKIAHLSKLGPAPTYIQADAADRDALDRAYRTVKVRHGAIHGVVHTAITLLDSRLAQMDEARFRASLSTKADISVRIAQVFAQERLDWVLFFSSTQSFSKVAWQSNYAAGCTFEDAFAHQLGHQWPCAVKVMNWSYWGSVGIVASEAYRARLAQFGVGSIEPDEGLPALERLLGASLSQVALINVIGPQALSAIGAVSDTMETLEGSAPSVIEQLPRSAKRTFAVDARAAETLRDLDRMLARLLLVQLRSVGLFTTAGRSNGAGRARPELPALYERWLEESARVLVEQGYASDAPAPDPEAVWSEWDAHKRVWAEEPGLRAQLNLVDVTLRALPAILTGQRPATDVLFPGSSLALVEGVYKHNAVVGYFNDVLADTVVEYIEARRRSDPNAKIRILEIGAGTGGTSEKVFRWLEPHARAVAEYAYTDISKAFLLHAQQSYGPTAPYLTYHLFDVEQPVRPQGLELGAYDLVIATNVLHATKRIRNTIRNAKAVLKRHGLLLLNEVADRSLFAHLTFGLLEGWWLYEDAALRIAGTPVLSPATWQHVLEEEGFQHVAFPARAAHGQGQQIVVAESDGMVRQARPARAAEEKRSDARPARVPSGRLRARTVAELTNVVSRTLGASVHELGENEPLPKFGLDSILVVSLTNELKKFFPELSSTVFFERQTIGALADYLGETDPSAAARWVGMAEEPAPAAPPAAAKAPRARPVVTRPKEIEPSSSIAIIGLSGRYPQAPTVAQFWENLRAGKSGISEIPRDRWDHSLYFDAEKGKPGKSYSKWGGFLDAIDRFDPLFFRISPAEAERLDPQERLFLEEAWASIEDAGYTPATLSGTRKVGVYVGVMNSTYLRHSSYWSIANRISYVCDFQGPSMAVDTACSSSLTAIHLAVEAIQSGACEVAIAGGVNLIVDPVQYTNLSAMNMLSSDDRCKAFGSSADGFVDGEGVGAIVLKPLHRAEADGDHIYGVIKGSLVNASGRTNGYTVPNPAAQRDLIEAVLRKSQVDPRAVSYIEAHGTGTELGDPIEIAGLTQAFASQTQDRQYCAIGSLKSNIGHLESAAGIAAVTKVLLQMRYRQLVPSLHAQTLNPHIDFERTPFKVQQHLEEWQGSPRIAGVSSFGAGGSNAHVILEEYDAPEAPASAVTREHPALIVLSAKTEDRLRAYAEQLLAVQHADGDLARVAYTLQVGREAMDHRLAFTASSMRELREKLRGYLDGQGAKGEIDDFYTGQVKQEKETLSLFAADEELREAVAKWIQRGKYGKLLELWSKGLQLDWRALYGDRMPRRISLPTYPFARERYWLEDRAGAPPADAPRPIEIAQPAQPAESAPADASMLFAEEWTPCELPDAASLSHASTLVVFLSDPVHQAAVSSAVRATVIFVSESESLEEALPRIAARHDRIDAIWYLWPLENADRVQDAAGVARLLQGLAAAGIQETTVLLAGAYGSAIERCHLESWIGYERSVKQVMPGIRLAVIHEPRGAWDSDVAARWVGRLVHEQQAAKLESALYLEGRRHTLRVQAIAAEAEPASPLRHGGTYLITGGLGGLGYLFAEHLAKRYAAHLILIGRSPIDAGKASQLEALHALGGEAMYIAADVADRERMREAVEQGNDRFGTIHGIIHAAGVESREGLLGKNLRSLEAVLSPKMAGTMVLHELSKEQRAGFVCHCSSSSAILGDFGSCDYAVANRFELAHAKYAADNAVAICWPLWAGGGMRLRDEAATQLYLRSSGQRALEAAEGLELFEQVLALHWTSGAHHALVMCGQEERVERMLGVGAETAQEFPQPERVARRRRPELHGLSIAQCISWEVQDMAAELLKLPRERLDVNENLSEFGFDSIALAEFAKRLSSRYTLDIAPSIFFSYGTLSKLAEHLASAHGDVMHRHYTEDAPEAARPKPTRPMPMKAPAPVSVPVEVAAMPTADGTPEPIAIVGMSGRFPDARSVDELWQILVSQKEAVREIPLERFDWRAVYQPQTADANFNAASPGKTNSKWLGALPGADEFDPAFFEISPKDAELMDPRQRLLLQESFTALEDAGYGNPQRSTHRIGMFVGAEQGDYQTLLVRSGVENSATANHDAILAARLSYFLNLRGPAMTLNTTCSSGLVALHQASLSLRAGECDAAIAAAVNLMLTPDTYIGMGQAGMLSPDGKCYAFDRRANGMVPGEAVVAIVLKRLSKAQADGDPIHAVIRGSGINYDGKTNGLTAPSGLAQAELLGDVYARANIDPRQIEYIVTHGTGTRLGDPIEIHALRDVFKDVEAREPFCALTSTKTNLGHTFAASGLASLVGLVQALRHETIPASLHCEQLSDYVDWSRGPFYVNRENRPWRRQSGKPRLGAVSAFGMSGTNAHVVLEGYDAPSMSAASPAPYFLLALSGKTDEALRQRARDLVDLLNDERRDWGPAGLAALSHTLLAYRRHYAHRCAWVATDRAQTVALLRKVAQGEKHPTLLHGKVSRDFTEQPMLREYANDLLGKLSAQQESERYSQMLAALGDLYCQGYALDWRALHAGHPPQRMALPGYPFARERHWVTSPSKAVVVERAELPSADVEEGIEPMLFSEEWQPSPLERAPAGPCSLVVLSSDRSRHAEWRGALERENAQAQIEFVPMPVGTNGAGLVPSLTESFRRIVERHGRIDAVWYLWALEGSTGVADHAPIVELIHGLAAAGIRNATVLLAAEGGSELDRCHVESWIGYERSIQRVLPDVRVAVIHDPSDMPNSAAVWARRLWNETHAEKAESALYIGEQRHALRVQPAQSTETDASPFRKGGTYLITGGSGGLGYLFAKHLAERYAAQLLLVGRAPSDAGKEAQIRELRALGGDAMYVAADVTDRDQMRAALEQGCERFGRLRGILHAAGVPSHEDVLHKSARQFEEVLAPKISGTLVLHELCADRALDFICHFSSASAVLGDVGSCDYAVGNRFELAHAKYVSKNGVAICWPLWADGGLRFGDAEATQLYLKSSGQAAVRGAEGVALFEQILARYWGGGANHALVMLGQKDRVHRMLGLAASPAPALPPIVIETSQPVTKRRPELLGLTLDECVLWELREIVSGMLKTAREKLDAHINLAEFGFDSIGLADLARRLSNRYSVDITPAIFFSHNNLSKLTEYLAASHTEAVRQCYGENEEPRRPVVKPVVNATTKPAPAPVVAPKTHRSEGPEPIAIIGMSGRFPGARTVDELWDVLVSGREAVQEIPLERFDWRGIYQAPNGSLGTKQTNSKWMGTVPGVDEFDPLFFEISPREAVSMDPRQRLLLQESYRALEDAGYGAAQIDRQKIGVFVGVEQGDYQTLLPDDEGTVGSSHEAILAARLSYFLNLRGPVMALNTACSSGLVAAHQACMSLAAGECDTAIAAGVNVIATPQSYIGMSQSGMLSPDGKCYAFDQRANGIVPGEAVVALVLKRLSQAQADGDLIFAVIRGSGINYDGKTNGITAPSGAAQADLIESVHRRAAVAPQNIEYIVTHGTGTRLGDPVEINALRDAFKGITSDEPFCALTSTKTNVGHTFAASGLVSLVNLVQALRHETIPASLHCEHRSDYIDWSQSPFFVNTRNKPWRKRSDRPRLGAVSSFGLSGTNAHMVVESYDAPLVSASTGAPYFVLTLSAKTEEALQQRARELAAVLKEQAWDAGALSSLSYTLLHHRQHFQHRCAVVVGDRAQAMAVLECAARGENHAALLRGKVAKEFVEQPALKRYVQSLLTALPGQTGDAQAYRESLTALADVYCQGYQLDAKGLYGDAPPPRVRVPTYPFARKRYWVQSVPKQQNGSSPKSAVANSALVGLHRLVPVWESVEISGPADQAFAGAGEGTLVVGGDAPAREAIRARYPHAVFSDIAPEDDASTLAERWGRMPAIRHIVWIAPAAPTTHDDALIAAQECGVLHGFRIIKALLASGHGDAPLAWTVVTHRTQAVHRSCDVEPSHAGIHGLLGSMAKEYPHWSIRLLDLQDGADWRASQWADVPADPRARCWAYRQGQWYRAQLVDARPTDATVPVYGHGNVYVVIGGAGHVGEAWTEWVIRHHQAKVIWLGRREKDAAIQSKIDRLAQFGSAPEYIAADASDRESLQRAYANIKRTHARIDGVVLSSIHLEPRSLAEMSEADFTAGLKAKVDVSVRAIQVFGEEPLQFVLFFSSLISFIKNPQQSAYAAACTFSDAFARSLVRRGRAEVKVVNWGFWDNPANDGLLEFQQSKQMGIGAITLDEAMPALDSLMNGPLDQMGIIKVTKPLLIEGMDPKSAVTVYPDRPSTNIGRMKARMARITESRSVR